MDTQLLDQLHDPNPERRVAAIKRIAQTKDRRYLAALETTYRTDPVAEVREVARKARRYIQRETGQEATTTPPTATAFPDKAIDAVEAAIHRARDDYANGDRAAAIKILGAVLDEHTHLQRRDDIRRLATIITDVSSPDDALRLLLNFDSRAALIQRYGDKRTSSNTQQNLRLIVIAAALMVIGVAALIILLAAQSTLSNIAGFGSGRSEVRTLSTSGTAYHLFVPSGFPTAFGWPVLIAIHDKGQSGADMMMYFEEHARREHIVVIAPTFANIDNVVINESHPAYQAMARDVNDILNEVDNDTNINVNGINIFGPVIYGRGAGGTFAAQYAGSYNFPLAGIAISNGGPRLATPPFISPVEDVIQMLILVGEDSSLRGAAEQYANAASRAGFFPDLHLLPGTAESISDEETQLVIAMVVRAYGLDVDS